MEQENKPVPSWPLNQIYFYITSGCNLLCRHCWIAPAFQTEGKPRPALDFDLFKAIIGQAKPLGLSGVKLTGGEPLIHPRILDIIDHVRTQELALTVETNGVACTAELALAMKQCRDTFVSVSLDAPEATIHEWMRGVEGCFEQALRGIRNLVEAGLRPQIIMSLVQRNKDRMEAMVRLAESLGAESVKFNLVQPTARGEQMHRRGETIPQTNWFSSDDGWKSNLLSQVSYRSRTAIPLLFGLSEKCSEKQATAMQNVGYSACWVYSRMEAMLYAVLAKSCLTWCLVTQHPTPWKRCGTTRAFSTRLEQDYPSA